MFSDIILRNSRRSRKENGLFFGSLVISVVAFYIILSLSTQDVMRFLQKMESDAVDKLLFLIPVFYVMTLGILFFLIYFACKYQFQRRSHEFGVYLMMGMSRSRLFFMLLAEDFISSVLALLAGLPVAVLLSEIISLITAKAVGMGIIGHRFTFSFEAAGLTAAGFLAVKLAAFLILTGRISRKETASLLANLQEHEKKQKSAAFYGIFAVCGILILGAAYAMAVQGAAWRKAPVMLLTLLLGFFGTILLFYGMRTFIALLIRTEKSGRKLYVFNMRQIQENVIRQSTSLAVSSLLILTALCCFGAGVGTAAASRQSSPHVLDYTFELNSYDEETAPEQVFPAIEAALDGAGAGDLFSGLFQMRISHAYAADGKTPEFSMDAVMDSLRALPLSEERDVLLNNLSYMEGSVYLICLSDYNRLLEASGKPALTLAPGEAAVYQDSEYTNAARNVLMNQVLAERPETELNKTPLYLTGEVQTADVVTDRSITLSFALILPDEQFMRYTQGRYEVYVNGVLDKGIISGAGLMDTYMTVNEKLDSISIKDAEFQYESYLQNMGRQLFYVVASSYITSYLAMIFLVVSNTIMGVQFLMNQQRTGRRYQTLVRMGATYKALCGSARKQISWFMGLPVVVAAIGSMFGVNALLAGILSSEAKTSINEMLVISGIVILLLCVIEYIYMSVIKRASDRYLLTLMQPRREE